MSTDVVARRRQMTTREEVTAWVLELCDLIDQTSKADIVTRLEQCILLKREVRSKGEELVRVLNGGAT